MESNRRSVVGLVVFGCIIGLMYALQWRERVAERPPVLPERPAPAKKAPAAPARVSGRATLGGVKASAPGKLTKGERMQLPDGWVDTGATKTLTISGRLRVWMSSAAGSTYDGGYCAQVPGYTVIGRGDMHEPDRSAQAYIVLVDGTQLPLEQVESSDPEHWDEALELWSQWYPWRWQAGPFRLGTRRVLRDGHTDPEHTPKYSGCCYAQESAWFADEETLLIRECAGYSDRRYYLGEETTPPPAGSFSDPLRVIGTINLNAYVMGVGGAGRTTQEVVTFDMITMDGDAVDASELDDGLLVGEAEGIIRAIVQWAESGHKESSSVSMAPPTRVAYNGRISQDHQPADDWAVVEDEWRGEMTFPADNGEYEEGHLSWAPASPAIPVTGLGMSLKAAWASAQDPPLPDTDYQVPLRGILPRGEEYVVAGRLSVAPVLATGCSAAASGHDAECVLTTSWRERILSEIDGYTHTKRRLGDNVWSWNTYGFARAAVAASGPGTVEMTVHYTRLHVEDPHVTGSARREGMVLAETPGTATYRLRLRDDEKDAQGRYLCWIDLLFPAGATEPMYLGRVDRLTFHSSSLSGYTVEGIDLAQRGPAHGKLAHGIPVRRTEEMPEGLTAEEQARWVAWHTPAWPVMTLAVDGSWVFGEVPDQAYKAGETGQDGGSIRYVEPITGEPSGVIMDAQWTLENYLSLLDRVEGLTATYDAAAVAAALTDMWGASLGTPQADWLWPEWVQVASGSAWELRLSPVCARVIPTNAYGYTVRVDHPLWAGIEVLSKRGARPMSKPPWVKAVRTDTGAVLATVQVDEWGYGVLSPLPANNELLVEVQSA
jgi:hypothetical protein